MKELILQLFGLYEPLTYVNQDGVDVIPGGLAGLDWPWLAGVGLFALTLYCVFRLIGGVIKK